MCGIALLAAVRRVVNKTTAADLAVAPLLVPDRIEDADAIVVPGAGVVGECVPNQSGVQRVLLAAKLWRAQRAPLVVFTGGTGSDSCTVAEAMALLARGVGLPSKAIRVETASRSTWENAAFSAPLLDGWGTRHILLVTDRLHMRRASSVFAHFGFVVSMASVSIPEGHVDNLSMLSAGLREYVALAYYRARGRLGVTGAKTRLRPAMGVDGSGQGSGTGPIVLLGASYAQSWTIASIAGIPVHNRGVAGQQSFEMRDRFERDVIAAHPRAVVLWGFINDVFRAPGDVEAALAQTRANYEQMLALARARGIEPILSTEVTIRPPTSWSDPIIFWVGKWLGKESYQDHINRYVRETNSWIRELGAREHLLVLDFEAVLSDEGGRRRQPFAQDDGSHITDAGYDALTSYVAPILQAHFAGRQSGT